MARAQNEAPVFSEPEGTFSVDYRNHDGMVTLGQGDWQFPIMWTAAGPGSIHVYNDYGSRVAVAPASRSISDVTADVFGRADFSSRARSPREGEVVLLQNPNDYAAAIEIQVVTQTDESEPGTNLAARYQILTDKTRDFSSGTVAIELLEFYKAVDEAIAALSDLAPAKVTDPPSFGIGHNNPPSDAALSEAELDQVENYLRTLRQHTRTKLGDSQLREAQTGLSEAHRKIVSWASSRISMVGEGFYREIGASIAKGVGWSMIALGTWLAFSGKISNVLDAIANLGWA